MRRAALTHSKHRNMFGLIGIEVDPDAAKISVRLARQWPRTDIVKITSDVAALYRKVEWDVTYVDQQTGHHLITTLTEKHSIPVRVITTQKNLKDPHDIERIRVMDKVEMVQWTYRALSAGQIRFPAAPSRDMKELMHQMSLFAEHKTEAGSIDYFAPGDEFDNLPKALMVVCFSVRSLIDRDGDTTHVMGGLAPPPLGRDLGLTPQETEEDIIANLGKNW